MMTQRGPAPGDRGCEHPWGFDILLKCRFGCGYVLTQAEIDAIALAEIEDGKRQAEVPEMQGFIEQDGCTVRIVG